MKSPSRTGNGRGKSFSERKRQLLEELRSQAQFRRGDFYEFNDSHATLHIKTRQ